MVKAIPNWDIDLPTDHIKQAEFENLTNSITTTENILCKIGHFVFLPEYEELREEYFDKLGSCPVIRHKIFKLYQVRESKKEIKNLMDRYSHRMAYLQTVSNSQLNSACRKKS